MIESMDGRRRVRISNYWISSAGIIEHICFTSRGFGCSKRKPVQAIRVPASTAAIYTTNILFYLI
jgi:hypothetical protein